MSKIVLYQLVIIFILLNNINCRQDYHALPSLTESYRQTDKQPFGAFIAYKDFRLFYNNRFVETVTDPFDVKWQSIQDYSDGKGYSIYFLIAKNLVLTYSEVKAFTDYVRAGNDLFISADYVDNKLLENINCNTERMGEIIYETRGIMHQTKVSMNAGDHINGSSYKYYYYPFLNSLSGYDTSFTKVLGVNEINSPNYIILFSGKGRIYLHVAPRVFSNYFLLSGDNYKYFEDMISYLPSDPKNIYWDEYYKNSNSTDKRNNSRNKKNNFSSLRVIMKYPPLSWAFLLALSGILLFILFNVKRKQRIIKDIRPNENTTVNFSETVGRLYLQKKDNYHLADKMITYFYEHIRNKFFISTAMINDEFLNALTGKSGIPKEQVRTLFILIGTIQKEEKADEEKLLELNSEIENFYKYQI